MNLGVPALEDRKNRHIHACYHCVSHLAPCVWVVPTFNERGWIVLTGSLVQMLVSSRNTLANANTRNKILQTFWELLNQVEYMLKMKQHNVFLQKVILNVFMVPIISDSGAH